MKKTVIGIWNYPNNRPNIQTYALCTFTFSLQTFTIFFLINAFINVYCNFFLRLSHLCFAPHLFPTCPVYPLSSFFFAIFLFPSLSFFFSSPLFFLPLAFYPSSTFRQAHGAPKTRTSVFLVAVRPRKPACASK